MVRHFRLIAAALFAVMTTTAAFLPAAAQTMSAQDAVNAATARANAIRGVTGVQPSTARLPPGDPCTALPLATVQSVFPGAKAGENVKGSEELLGIKKCMWKNAAGTPILSLMDSFDRGTTAKQDAIGMADIYTGGTAGSNVRIETFPGIGADNAGFAEVTDTKRGLKNDMDFVQLRKGNHSIAISAMGLAGRDRAAAMKALETLGKQAAGRL